MSESTLFLPFFLLPQLEDRTHFQDFNLESSRIAAEAFRHQPYKDHIFLQPTIIMKLAFATALMASTAAAFSPSFSTSSSALKMSAVETEVYTFEKSEEIFAEAKNVSLKL